MFRDEPLESAAAVGQPAARVDGERGRAALPAGRGHAHMTFGLGEVSKLVFNKLPGSAIG